MLTHPTPTRQGRQGRQTGQGWSAHPRLALLVRVVAFVVPIAASVGATSVVNTWLPQSTTTVGRIVLLLVLSVVATGTLFVADKAARKLLPLAALLKLSLVFPDHAPSRYRTALRTGTVHQLERQVADIKAHGFADDETKAAEQLLELVAALSAHDRITRGHAERVRAYARLIGEELGLSEDDISRLHWSALLHDVGKLFVPAEILNKPGKLTYDEYEMVKLHPGWGAELVEPLRGWLGEWVDAVGQHHEWWDGHGYPNGLAGHDIALAARIVSVADVFDVITSTRSYKKAEGVVEAREELARCAGTQFEPRIVRAFLTVSLGRLRLLMGPLSSLAHLPGLNRIPIAGASAAASGLVTLSALLFGGFLDDPEPAAAPAVERPTEGVPVTTPDPAPVDPPAAPPPPPVPPVASPDPVPPPEPAAVSPLPLPPTPPAPEADTATTSEDTAVLVDVLGNDAHTERLAWVGSASQGTATVVDGQVRYQPAADAVGADTFSYGVEGPGGTGAATVTVTVLPVNDAPAFTPGANVVVDEDAGPQVLAGWAANVRPGPTDEASQTVSFTAVPSNPFLFSSAPSVNASGTLRFTPTPEAWGTTTVVVTARDNGGTALGGVDASPAHVLTITVTAVNDKPTAGNDTATVLEDGSVVISVLGNDSDPEGDALTVTGATSADGTATTNGTTVTYSPAPNSNGTQTVSYTLSDGGLTDTASITVTVTPVNDAPTFSAGADVTVAEDAVAQSIAWASVIVTGPSDESGQGLTFSATTADPSLFAVPPAIDATGTLTFTPAANAWGTTTVDVLLADDGGTANGGADTSPLYVLTITLTAEPDPPVARDDSYATPESTPLTVPAPGVLGNDSDEDGDTLTTTLTIPPASGGAVVLLPDGSFVYTPVTGFTGDDTFTYTVSDGALSDTATVTILVSSTTTTSTFFLANSGAGLENWALTSTAPSTNNPDPDGDGDPGLTVDNSDLKLTNTDIDKYQQWGMVTSSDLALTGPITLGLWSTSKDFDPDDEVSYSMWVQDCAADGTGCVTVASAIDVRVEEWNGGVAGWVHRNITVGPVNHTITGGRMLRVRVMFDHDDVWISTDSSMPSTLTVLQPI